MRIATRSTPRTVLTIAVVALATYCAVFPLRSEAQGGEGQNAVCSSTSVCTSSSDTVGSGAFVDASMFAAPSGTICSVIYSILVPGGYSAAVIDARGLVNSTPPTSMTCAANTTPWNNGSTYVNKPSTILLPAGTITTSVPWVLPGNTKLIGIATSGNNSLLDTTIQASFSSGAVLQFGDSHCPSSGCQGISVEHLSISGDFDEII
jgi:hypothetical protein